MENCLDSESYVSNELGLTDWFLPKIGTRMSSKATNVSETWSAIFFVPEEGLSSPSLFIY